MYKRIIKRFIDILAGLIALPFLLIAMLFIAPIIYFTDRGPIFYVAKRRGRNGKVFKMIKFRSMYVNAPDIRNDDNTTFNGKNDKRVTRIGRILRETSLDEITQLLNVLKGDMSLIGPRPTIPRDDMTYDDLSEPKRKRLGVRPGITGYSQAYYRNSITGAEKLEKDCFYVDNVSLILDIKIILKTIARVVAREEIYSNK